MSYWEQYYNSRRISNDSDGWLAAYREMIGPGSAVLDLGCGAGTNIAQLLQMGAAVTAADFSENAVVPVREFFGEKLSGADCFDMRKGFPYGDEAFDIVVADLSLHYFTWNETREIIAEIHRILKEKGRLIARVHSLANLDSMPGEEIEPHYYMMYGYHRRYFSPEELQILFSGWNLPLLQEKPIRRYQRIKHVIEFIAEKV